MYILYPVVYAVERYKARFCAKVFTQVECVDFTETFAPVAKMNSIRVLLWGFGVMGSLSTIPTLKFQWSR
jgi:hypothetical protein